MGVRMQGSIMLDIINVIIFVAGFICFYYIASRVKKIQKRKHKILIVALFLVAYVLSVYLENYIYNINISIAVKCALASFIGFILRMLD